MLDSNQLMEVEQALDRIKHKARIVHSELGQIVHVMEDIKEAAEKMPQTRLIKEREDAAEALFDQLEQVSDAAAELPAIEYLLRAVEEAKRLKETLNLEEED